MVTYICKTSSLKANRKTQLALRTNTEVIFGNVWFPKFIYCTLYHSVKQCLADSLGRKDDEILNSCCQKFDSKQMFCHVWAQHGAPVFSVSQVFLIMHWLSVSSPSQDKTLNGLDQVIWRTVSSLFYMSICYRSPALTREAHLRQAFLVVAPWLWNSLLRKVLWFEAGNQDIYLFCWTFNGF